MKFGFLINPLKDIKKEIKKTSKLGFDYLELSIEGPQGMPERLRKRKKEIKNLLRKYNLGIIGHTAWWIELGTPYKEVRKAWLKESKKMIDIAVMLGCEKIVFHSHSRGMFVMKKESKKEILEYWIESLKKLTKYAKKKKIKIILENAAMKGEITSTNDIKYIVDKVKNLYVHIDIGHAFINGGMKNVLKFIKIFKNKLEHLHFHDNHGKEDEHLPIGKGDINYKKIIKELKKIKYDKTITFEIFTEKKGLIKQSMNKIKKLFS